MVSHIPNLDALAADGLRSTNTPHHSNHMAGISGISTGYPSHDGTICFNNSLLSKILLLSCCNTDPRSWDRGQAWR